MTATTSALYHVRLRRDVPREVARSYWAGPHAGVVRGLPHVAEYRQHHFSTSDHSFWPATPRVGVEATPGHLDGFAELTFSSVAGALLVAPHSREVFFDEQNVFEWVRGHLAGPYGGRWHDEPANVGHHTALMIRRRGGVRRSDFRGFIHDVFAPALQAGGAAGLRSYVFRSRLPHPTPGVSHQSQPHARFHATLLFTTPDRAAIADVIAHPDVADAIERQSQFCTAIHAYAVEQLVPVITPLRGVRS